MSEEWELHDLVGVSELAEYYAVSRPAIWNWTNRYPDFPQPKLRLKAGKIYSFKEVSDWYHIDGQ